MKLDYSFLVDEAHAVERLDLFLTKQRPDWSRSFIKNLISKNLVLVNQKPANKAGQVLREGDVVACTLPSLEKNSSQFTDLGVEVVYEHSDFLIINKPAGLIVHAPMADYSNPTLVDWLTHKFYEITAVGDLSRPGIVHRLDQQTSGLMVIPRNNQAHAVFGEMFQQRQMQKSYLALVKGQPPQTGAIDYAIVRHPVLRNKMTHVKASGLVQSWAKNAREAKTSFQVLRYYANYALVLAKPVTGRTHQIRVHLSAIGHSLLGDELYGNLNKEISRQALHAYRLEFNYLGQSYSFTANPPADFQKLCLDFDFALSLGN